MIGGQSFFGIAHKMRFFNDSPKKINWRVIGAADCVAGLHSLPLELQYALAIHPSRVQYLKTILSEGHALALGRNPVWNRRIHKAMNCVSAYHHGAVHPWLEDLVVKNIMPVFSESDLADAAERGVDLMEQIGIIKNHVSELLQIKIVESGNRGMTADDKKLIELLARDIQKIQSMEAAEVLYGRTAQNRQDVLMLFLFGALFFGPLIHGLEMIFSGLGKFAAVILPVLFIRLSEVLSDYQHGHAWWQIKKGIKKQWPEAVALIFGALAVEPLLGIVSPWVAGLLFIFSANAMILGHLLRAHINAKKIRSALEAEGKLARGYTIPRLSLLYGPLWLIRVLSFMPAVLLSVFVFTTAGSLLANGWLLFFTACSYYFSVFLLGELWFKTASYRFKYRLRGLLRKAIIS